MPFSPADLLVDLGEPGLSLRARLTMALRAAIRRGQLAPGSALPSSRQLASDLGISRGVVVEAYGQLAAEGYVTARPGAGTLVASGVRWREAPTPAAVVPDTAADSPVAQQTGKRDVDLRPGTGDLSLFPRRAWLRATRDSVRSLPTADLGYGPAGGAEVLRACLADYLARVRGSMAGADGLVVTTGATQGLALLARLLRRQGHRRVAVEDPGLPLYRDVLAAAGLQVVDVAVDEQGLVVDDLVQTGCRAVVCTPAHQYPTGAILSASRRAALVQWAQTVDGLLVEDDRDAEFRYGRPPVGCMQGLAPERVALVGSVSQSLAPAVRIGWLIPPPHLLDEAVALKRVIDRGSDVLTQHALSALLDSGEYDRHLRMLRRRYAARRQRMVEVLAARAPRWVVLGAAGGLHLCVRLPADLAEAQLVDAAAGAGILLTGLAEVCHSQRTDPAVLLSFARRSPDLLEDALLRLLPTAQR